MTTLFHSGTPDDVLILALRDHSDPAVTELLARYTPFVGVDLDDYVLREDVEGLKESLLDARAARNLAKARLKNAEETITKYRAALVYARSELAAMSEMLGSLSDEIAGGLDNATP